MKTGRDEVLEQALAWLAGGLDVATATVVSTWGSSPLPPGSMAAIAEDGNFTGSVSGGCIEGAVVGEALEAIKDGTARLLDFGVTDEMAWEVGLACGGEMKVHVAPANSPELVRDLLSCRPVVLATRLETGERSVVRGGSVSGGLVLSRQAIEAAARAAAMDQSRVFDDPSGPVFLHVFNRPLRMIIVGAVHVAQALAPMAALTGYEVTVIDPRSAFATAERFPGVTLSHAWPGGEEMNIDERTAVVALTHDPKIDDPALMAALRDGAFYLGALGSRRNHGKRRRRLAAQGADDDALDRIHGPIGLDLGGCGPAEIAVAILAQVIAAGYGKA